MICQNDWDFLSEELDLVKGGLTNRKQSCRKYPLGTWKCRHRSGSTRRDNIYKPSYAQNRNSSAHASDYTGLSESKTGTTKVLFTLRSCGKRTLAALLHLFRLFASLSYLAAGSSSWRFSSRVEEVCEIRHSRLSQEELAPEPEAAVVAAVPVLLRRSWPQRLDSWWEQPATTHHALIFHLGCYLPRRCFPKLDRSLALFLKSHQPT